MRRLVTRAGRDPGWPHNRSALRGRVIHGGDGRKRLIFHRDRLGAISRRRRRIRQDNRNRLANKDHATAREHQAGARRRRHIGQIIASQDPLYAGRLKSAAAIYARDIGMGIGAQDEARVQHARQFEIASIFQIASHLGGTVNHRCRFANK